jgi:hypothetical protein
MIMLADKGNGTGQTSRALDLTADWHMAGGPGLDFETWDTTKPSQPPITPHRPAWLK